MQSPKPTGPLSGLLVADFSRVLAGPLATMYLADLGATVIKVERPGLGDDTRQWGPPYVGATSTYFTSVNRNKHSIVLDLADEADRTLAHRLAGRADVLVENFRPGKLTEFGLDHPSLRATCPALVYCSITGFGGGAGADLPGYDFIVQAVGGLMSLTGQPGGEPTKVGVALVDVLTGLHATVGILAALRARERTGQGQHVEVNLLSSLLASLVNQGAAYINGAGIPGAMGNRHPSIAPYETLATGDRPLAIAAGNDRQFRTLVTVLGRPRTRRRRTLHHQPRPGPPPRRPRGRARRRAARRLGSDLGRPTRGGRCALRRRQRPRRSDRPRRPTRPRSRRALRRRDRHAWPARSASPARPSGTNARHPLSAPTPTASVAGSPTTRAGQWRLSQVGWNGYGTAMARSGTHWLMRSVIRSRLPKNEEYPRCHIPATRPTPDTFAAAAPPPRPAILTVAFFGALLSGLLSAAGAVLLIVQARDLAEQTASERSGAEVTDALGAESSRRPWTIWPTP